MHNDLAIGVGFKRRQAVIVLLLLLLTDPVLTGVAAGLGVWGLTERSERLALAGRLLAANPAPASALDNIPAPTEAPSPDGYFNLRRRLEQDPNRGFASPELEPPLPLGPPPPQPALLTSGQRDSLFDQ